jgi:hypothetical protein
MTKGRNKLRLKDVGGFKVRKGEFRAIDLIALDATPHCTGTNCKAFRMCTYKKDGPCRMRRKFLLNVINNYLRNCSRATEWDFQRIGTMLVPLWDQLCMLKIEELSIVSPMRGEKIHPVYGAIRETIRTITKLEPEFKLKALRRGNEGGALPEEAKDTSVFGNPDFYDTLTQDEEEMPLDEI